jgi:hypothetical protein
VYLKNAPRPSTTRAAITMLAMSLWKTVAPATRLLSSPHGSPTWRCSRPIRSPATTWSARKMPTVTVAAAKGGLPTIGRMATRSMTIATSAVAAMAARAASRNGTPRSTAKADVK